MAYTAKQAIAIAVAEIGYHEKATNAQLDDKTANSGSNNRTKYARDLYAVGYYNGNKQGVAWCDMFFDWCLWQLCGKNRQKAEALEYQVGTLGAGTPYSAGYYKAANAWYKIPAPGDQIFFTDSSGSICHTGMVESVDADNVYTIEGNADNQVKRCTYKKTYSRIAGYGRPKYDTEPANVPATPKKSTKEIAEEVIAGKWGNGEERKQKLTAAGYDYKTIQDEVNKILAAQAPATTTPTQATPAAGPTASKPWRGVDLSYANGDGVNFEKLKAAGINYAIIRAGYGRYASQKDSCFETNYTKAKAAKMPVGCYWYSYATDVAGAKAEAQTFIQTIKGKSFEMPVYYDVEEQKQFKTGKENVSAIIKAFCETLEAAGYFCGFYMSTYYLKNYVTEDVQKRFCLWVAEYGSKCNYPGPGVIGMWQNSSTGKINGVNGEVDTDYCYVDYVTKIAAQGRNGVAKTPAETPPTEIPGAHSGDINGDGKVNSADARLAMRAAAKLDELTEEQKIRGDVNNDGKFNSTDARTIWKKAAKLEE